MSDQIPSEPWWQPAIKLFVQVSGWIVGPVLIAVFFGRWLDEHFHTEPWLLLGCVAVAFAITNIGMIKQVKKYSADMEKLDKIKNDKL
jgi:F0F1-type ATP synthase assembly protein I